jgi:AraC-like DNA-binding protein
MNPMQLIHYRLAPPLDRYIECFWWSRREEPLECCEHMLPSGGAQLLFALHDAPITCWPNSSLAAPIQWSGSIVHGPQSRYYIAGRKPRGTVAGVSFRPGAAGAVLGVGLTELADRHVTLDALWGRRGRELHELLLAAADPAALFRILDLSLSARIQRPLLMHPAVAHALASRAPGAPWRVRVADIERDAGYSPKHFIALFRAAVGLTPKHYYRIQRFNAALRHIASGAGAGLADVAAFLGYSDQAHLTREFREFAGVAPTQYRLGGPGSPLHHRTSLRDAGDTG